jgi:hypothetical protein
MPSIALIFMTDRTFSRRDLVTALLLSPGLSLALPLGADARLQLEVLVFKTPSQAGLALLPTPPKELPSFSVNPERVRPSSQALLLSHAAKALQQQGYPTLLHRQWDIDAPANARIGVRVDEPQLRAACQIQRGQTLNLLWTAWVAADSAQGFFGMSEQRRIKLNEAQYFDHPNFGTILLLRAEQNTA